MILCGGYGSRLAASMPDHIGPKYLVPVLGRPFCDWQLDLLTTQGFERFISCLGWAGPRIRNHVDYRWRDLDKTFVFDETD